MIIDFANGVLSKINEIEKLAVYHIICKAFRSKDIALQSVNSAFYRHKLVNERITKSRRSIKLMAVCSDSLWGCFVTMQTIFAKITLKWALIL